MTPLQASRHPEHPSERGTRFNSLPEPLQFLRALANQCFHLENCSWSATPIGALLASISPHLHREGGGCPLQPQAGALPPETVSETLGSFSLFAAFSRGSCIWSVQSGSKAFPTNWPEQLWSPESHRADSTPTHIKTTDSASRIQTSAISQTLLSGSCLSPLPIPLNREEQWIRQSEGKQNALVPTVLQWLQPYQFYFHDYQRRDLCHQSQLLFSYLDFRRYFFRLFSTSVNN